MDFGANLKTLRTEAGFTQEQLAAMVDVAKSNISKYEKGTLEPNLETLKKLSDALDAPIGFFFQEGYDEANLVTFSGKLSYQLMVNLSSLSELASYLGVQEELVVSWLKGERLESAKEYYKKLSEYFKILPRYWTSPKMISPGIEPDADEYMLILLRREYLLTGILKEDLYGDISYYFPGINTYGVSKNSQKDKLYGIIEELDDGQLKQLLGYADCLATSIEKGTSSVAADDIPPEIAAK